jgi:hypothetical protein
LLPLKHVTRPAEAAVGSVASDENQPRGPTRHAMMATDMYMAQAVGAQARRLMKACATARPAQAVPKVKHASTHSMAAQTTSVRFPGGLLLAWARHR